MSLDRYFSISRYKWYQKFLTNGRTFCFIILCWSVAVLVSFVFANFDNDAEKSMDCKLSKTYTTVYVYVFVGIEVLTPVVFMLILQWQVMKTAVSHLHTVDVCGRQIKNLDYADFPSIAKESTWSKNRGSNHAGVSSSFGFQGAFSFFWTIVTLQASTTSRMAWRKLWLIVSRLHSLYCWVIGAKSSKKNSRICCVHMRAIRGTRTWRSIAWASPIKSSHPWCTESTRKTFQCHEQLFGIYGKSVVRVPQTPFW